MDNFVDELIEIEDGGNLLRGFLQLEEILNLIELQVAGSGVIGAGYGYAGGHGSSQSSAAAPGRTAFHQNRCEATYLGFGFIVFRTFRSRADALNLIDAF